MAAQYHEFSDWYTQFNVRDQPEIAAAVSADDAQRGHRAASGHRQGSPPDGRLDPNDAPIKIASRHQLAAQLDSADMDRVAEAREYLSSFQSVSFREYRQGK